MLGKYFFAKALIGFAVYTLGLAYFEKIPFELNTEHFLAVAFGGAILGIGLSLILRNGGCIDALKSSPILLFIRFTTKPEKTTVFPTY